jgi:Sec-independent protein translocase protein TatA
MKVTEILAEAGPAGTSGLAKWTGKAKKATADLRQSASAKLFGTKQQQLAKQNQKKWYDTVKRKQKENVDMTDENTYRDHLYKYLGSNGKLKLSRELKRMVGQLPLTDQNILKIMAKTIGDRIAAKEKLANAPKINVPPTATPGPTP